MIRIESLSKSFGAVEAVRDLTLDVPAGELFCFLGPNGAGKTTTIKMMCGLLRPDRGRVLLRGIDVQEDPRAAHAITGYIPDSPFLYERLTVRELYDFTGDIFRIPRAEVARRRAGALVTFGLQEHASTLVKDLSLGYRQRVIYAATLLHEPEVLFVDEPFVGLDPASIRLIKDLLKGAARAGAAVFMTTHILALIEDVADRVGIILGGRLVALGTIAELRAQTSSGGRLEDIFLQITGGANGAAGGAG